MPKARCSTCLPTGEHFTSKVQHLQARQLALGVRHLSLQLLRPLPAAVAQQCSVNDVPVKLPLQVAVRPSAAEMVLASNDQTHFVCGHEVRAPSVLLQCTETFVAS